MMTFFLKLKILSGIMILFVITSICLTNSYAQGTNANPTQIQVFAIDINQVGEISQEAVLRGDNALLFLALPPNLSLPANEPSNAGIFEVNNFVIASDSNKNGRFDEQDQYYRFGKVLIFIYKATQYHDAPLDEAGIRAIYFPMEILQRFNIKPDPLTVSVIGKVVLADGSTRKLKIIDFDRVIIKEITPPMIELKPQSELPAF